MDLHNQYKNHLENIYSSVFLEEIDFDFPSSNTAVVQKWNWDYQQALDFQYHTLEFVRQNRDFRVFIFCSHPHCFTMGSGLQKGKDEHLKQLVEFDHSQQENLTFPLYKIKRGGGVTFHYPDQWVVYPIINLNSPQFSLATLTYWLLDSVKEILSEEYNLNQLDSRGPFLGLWNEGKKLLSLGIGAKHFVTHHGIALNLVRDKSMFTELQKINPCGLNPQTYVCLDEIIEESNLNETRNVLTKKLMDRLKRLKQ